MQPTCPLEFGTITISGNFINIIYGKIWVPFTFHLAKYFKLFHFTQVAIICIGNFCPLLLCSSPCILLVLVFR